MVGDIIRWKLPVWHFVLREVLLVLDMFTVKITLVA